MPSLSLALPSFLSLSLSRLVRYYFLLRRPSLRLFSRIRALHTRVSSRSHTDINRDRILTYCLIIGPPREAACFSIPSLSLWLRGGILATKDGNGERRVPRSDVALRVIGSGVRVWEVVRVAEVILEG